MKITSTNLKAWMILRRLNFFLLLSGILFSGCVSEDGYQSDYTKKYDAGFIKYKENYDTGFEDGIDKSKDEIYEESASYKAGYNAGLEEGHELGYVDCLCDYDIDELEDPKRKEGVDWDDLDTDEEWNKKWDWINLDTDEEGQEKKEEFNWDF